VFRESRPPPNASIIDNPVNPDFGLRTPGSGRWSGSSPKLNSVHGNLQEMSSKSIHNFVCLSVCLSARRITDRSENITSFGGGNYTHGKLLNRNSELKLVSFHFSFLSSLIPSAQMAKYSLVMTPMSGRVAGRIVGYLLGLYVGIFMRRYT